MSVLKTVDVMFLKKLQLDGATVLRTSSLVNSEITVVINTNKWSLSGQNCELEPNLLYMEIY